MAKEGVSKLAMSEDDEFFESENSENDDQGGTEGSAEAGKEGDAGDSGETGATGSDNGDGEGSEGKGESGEESDHEEGAGEDDKGGEKKEDGEGEEGKGEGEVADLLIDFEGEEGEQPADSQLSIKNLATTLEIELENESPEELAEKINAKIEAARAQVDVSKFSPEARKLVRHLNEHEGKLTDFFSNRKISDLQGVLSMEPEDKLRMVKRQELVREGTSAEELDEKLDNFLTGLSVRQIIDAANKIDQNAQELINAEINEIVGSREKEIEKQKVETQKRVVRERESLKNFVQKQDDFFGMPISAKAKQAMIGDIDSGKFDSLVTLTDNEIKFAAYMIKRAGGKLKTQIAQLLSEKNREGYNNALDKTTKKLHNSQEGGSSTHTGHQSSKGDQVSNFDHFADIED